MLLVIEQRYGCGGKERRGVFGKSSVGTVRSCTRCATLTSGRSRLVIPATSVSRSIGLINPFHRPKPAAFPLHSTRIGRGSRGIYTLSGATAAANAKLSGGCPLRTRATPCPTSLFCRSIRQNRRFKQSTMIFVPGCSVPSRQTLFSRRAILGRQRAGPGTSCAVSSSKGKSLDGKKNSCWWRFRRIGPLPARHAGGAASARRCREFHRTLVTTA
jgi:hypothetical protein